MGFSHALDLAHAAHEHILVSSSPDTQLLQDRRPCPLISASVPTVLIYADNAGHLSTAANTSNASRERLSKILNERGLETHKIETAASEGKSWVCGLRATLGLSPRV